MLVLLNLSLFIYFIFHSFIIGNCKWFHYFWETLTKHVKYRGNSLPSTFLITNSIFLINFDKPTLADDDVKYRAYIL